MCAACDRSDDTCGPGLRCAFPKTSLPGQVAQCLNDEPCPLVACPAVAPICGESNKCVCAPLFDAGADTGATTVPDTGATTVPDSAVPDSSRPDSAAGCSLAVTPDFVSGSDPGGAGAAVTILAQNLDPNVSGDAVHFGAALAPIVQLVLGTGQDATILVRVPKGPVGTVPVTVSTCAGDTVPAQFPVNPTDAANPASFTPLTGRSGTLLTLTGTNFTGATQCDVFVLSPLQHFLSTFTATSDTSGSCMNSAILPAGTKAYVGVKSPSGTGFASLQFTMQ